MAAAITSMQETSNMQTSEKSCMHANYMHIGPSFAFKNMLEILIH